MNEQDSNDSTARRQLSPIGACAAPRHQKHPLPSLGLGIYQRTNVPRMLEGYRFGFGKGVLLGFWMEDPQTREAKVSPTPFLS